MFADGDVTESPSDMRFMTDGGRVPGSFAHIVFSFTPTVLIFTPFLLTFTVSLVEGGLNSAFKTMNSAFNMPVCFFSGRSHAAAVRASDCVREKSKQHFRAIFERFPRDFHSVLLLILVLI